MKNRINGLFGSKNHEILNIYFTAGYPALDDTMTVMEALQEAGVDLIEIGIPFSDPIADGPTIQASNHVALTNGMTIAKLISQLKQMRKTIHVPVVLMGYLNPVMQYGFERFCKEIAACGVDGLILPDLPMAEYLETYKSVFEEYNLSNVFLITPQTSEGRIREIDSNSTGFIYMVSSASITGAKKGISDEQVAYFQRISAMQLSTPRLIGFGISDQQSFQMACNYANGAIIGSAFINLLEANKDIIAPAIKSFIASIKGK